MTDDIAAAKARNREIVRAQREHFGLARKPEKRERESKGIAHITLGVSLMPEDMDEQAKAEAIEKAIEKAKLTLRRDIQDKDGVVDQVMAVRLLNGDVEVRAEYTQKIGLDS